MFNMNEFISILAAIFTNAYNFSDFLFATLGDTLLYEFTLEEKILSHSLERRKQELLPDSTANLTLCLLSWTQGSNNVTLAFMINEGGDVGMSSIYHQYKSNLFLSWH